MRSQTLNAFDSWTINVAMRDIENILGATVWAVVATDGTGTFLWPRPDSEQAVMDYLATVDWRTARRIAQEHIP